MSNEEIIKKMEEVLLPNTGIVWTIHMEALREAIALIREYQAFQNSDTSARLAAIKDIPTQRLIELAVAEAAGLISISASAAERAHQDAQPNEPLTLEELRGIEGKSHPVWCDKVNGYVFIAAVETEPYNQVWFFNCKGCCGTVLYYRTKFYRRPPKEA